MVRGKQTILPLALVLAASVLPALLLLSSLRTLASLGEVRADLLRSRAAGVAARLETLPAEADPLETLAGEEPALYDVRIYETPAAAAADAEAGAIFDGRELFRVSRLGMEGRRIFRVYVPFHRLGTTMVARIDLDEASADAFLTHARHNVVAATVASGALILLAAYGIWSAKQRLELERKQLQLEHLAHLGRMSAVLAHEIRNPLGTVKGFVQLAQERAGEEVRSLLDPVLGEVRRLEALVQELLLYGRAPAPILRDVAWQQLAEAVRTAVAEIQDGRPVRITVHNLADEVCLRTDPDLARHVLVNLIRNAVEAIGDRPGSVTVTCVARPGRAVISVVDDGPGIPEESLARVFQSFYTTKSSGTGLGLPIARKLAEALGGSLEIENRAEGGVEARFSVPLATGISEGSEANGEHTCH